jgi:hypothetical protein
LSVESELALSNELSISKNEMEIFPSKESLIEFINSNSESDLLTRKAYLKRKSK